MGSSPTGSFATVPEESLERSTPPHDPGHVRTVLTLLGTSAGKRVFFTAEVTGSGPSFEIREMHWAEVFDRTVREAKLHAVRVGKDLLLVSSDPIEAGSSQLDDTKE